ncbi:MAG: hypothetical protein QXQ64_06245 [Candidatus Bathyarchaeia archaeon]
MNKVLKGYRIDDDVYRKLRNIASSKNVTESTLVNEALREYVSRYYDVQTLSKAFDRIKVLEEKVAKLEGVYSILETLKYLIEQKVDRYE